VVVGTVKAYALHILHNRHEYGPMNMTMTLLKPLNNTSLLNPCEHLFIQSLHKEGRLISKQNPGELNPLIQLAIDPSQKLPTLKNHSSNILFTVHTACYPTLQPAIARYVQFHSGPHPPTC
jgi:hypothetical protein